ncbi:unannotated protein [freshwater metagenome]|uniref:Unannotated protein n=1 Tax=freshwater metagenome TaxID=449393 RepID=A0A6J6IA94_9ZZZZ
MVDSENRRFGKVLVEGGIEFDGRLVVASERLLDDEAGAAVESGGRDSVGDCREHRGRNGEVEDRMLGVAGSDLQAIEGSGIVVVPVDVGHLVGESVECRLIPDLAGIGDRCAAVVAQIVVGPVVARDADHRDIETSADLKSVDGGEEFLLGQITGGAEEHQEVGAGKIDGGRHQGHEKGSGSEGSGLINLASRALPRARFPRWI